MIGLKRCLVSERWPNFQFVLFLLHLFMTLNPITLTLFFLSLNLSSTPEVTITKSVNKSRKEVTEKEYKKEG